MQILNAVFVSGYAFYKQGASGTIIVGPFSGAPDIEEGNKWFPTCIIF